MQFNTWLAEQGRGARRRISVKLGVSDATISRIASGLQTPTLRIAAAIEKETEGAVKAIELIGAA